MITNQAQSVFKQGNTALRNKDYIAATGYYIKALRKHPSQLNNTINANLQLTWMRYHKQRSVAAKPSAAVCSWELAHKAADRVYTLCKLYQTFAEVEIIGSIFVKWGRKIWEPILNTEIRKHIFVVEKESLFIKQAIELVCDHPYDIVHLSSPKMPNILIGILYKKIWKTKVLIDIDDEELGSIIKNNENLNELLTFHSNQFELKNLIGDHWTSIAVNLANAFDGLTVSNSKLQQVYGGQLIEKARDKNQFQSTPTPNCSKQSKCIFPKIAVYEQNLQQTTIKCSNNPLAASVERFAQIINDDILNSVLRIPKQSSIQKLRKKNYALLIHVSNLIFIDDFAMYIANFPSCADQYVTFPEKFTDEQRQKIYKVLPNANFIKVPNIGQDIEALFYLMDSTDLNQYRFACKIHMRNYNKVPREWHLALLRSVLGSRKQVNEIIEHFENDPNVKLAGSKQLFVHGASNLWSELDKDTHQILKDLSVEFDYTSNDWGYIASPCFWIRTEILRIVHNQIRRKNLSKNKFTKTTAEKIFGAVAAAMSGKVLLNDLLNINAPPVIVKDYPSELPKEKFSTVKLVNNLKNQKYSVSEAAKEFKLRSNTKDENSSNKMQIKGSLDLFKNRTEIQGWLAQIGSETPRNAIVRIDNNTELTVLANFFRSDLKEHKINKGRHAFSLPVPRKFIDEKCHCLELIDCETMSVIDRKTCSWESIKRDYFNFEGFLKYSMTQPVIFAPFTEEDKRCFAFMENIANRLSRRASNIFEPPLVSVIMPVYNREKIVPLSIRSVLEQSYQNFELIVIDDGSSDNSVSVVETFYDKRIRLIKHKANVGHAAARNTGLRSARGDIIAYLDSDNTWDDRYVAAIVGAFEELPYADAVYSGQLLYRGQSKDPYAIRYGHNNRALLENRNYIDLNVFAHRQNIINNVNGFDEKLKRFVDYDLILRVSEQGKLFSIPILLCKYYYDKAEYTVTSDMSNLADMDILRSQLRNRINNRLQVLGENDLDHNVTVIIPNWQSREDISECLDSLKKNDNKNTLEIIVIDNASDNDVVAFLRNEALNRRITLIENKRNFGFTYAVNQGIASARAGSDILLLNNDAIILDGAIAALQRGCYTLPKAGITVPRQILPSGTKTLRTHVLYADERYECDVNISAHHRNIASVPVFHSGNFLELSYAPFFCVYIRRDIINDLGSLDAEYGRHYRSDRVFCDLMRNVLKRKLYYVPEAFVIHKLQKATDILRDKAMHEKGFELMFKRNQWDAENAFELNFRQAPWDIF